MPRQTVNLYPLHDEDPTHMYYMDPGYLVHKPGENEVTLVRGYWQGGERMQIGGKDTIDRLIEALQDARKQMEL